MKRHVLVTNDYPPKIGGIQNYLWELWRRLPADSFAVYTTPYHGAATFDAAQAYPIERSPEPVIGPYPWLIDRIDRFASANDAELVIIDPALPLGALGPRLAHPYGVVLHGAEVTIPGRLPMSRQLLGSTLRSASLVVSAGQYALTEAERCAGRQLPAVVIPPGVDSARFTPPDVETRRKARDRFGLSDDQLVVASVNRLVPRKGMDTLVRASIELDRRLRAEPAGQLRGARVLIGGRGRHQRHLDRLITELAAPVDLLGRIDDDAVVELYQAADTMAMLCRDRWFGLEQEGFGIVFLEAAAAGLPQVAGRSGGAHEAVVDGKTGFVVDEPSNVADVVDALERLARSPELRSELGRAARARVEAEFDYAHLAARLALAIDGVAAG